MVRVKVRFKVYLLQHVYFISTKPTTLHRVTVMSQVVYMNKFSNFKIHR